jgi:erythromycin esterase
MRQRRKTFLALLSMLLVAGMSYLLWPYILFFSAFGFVESPARPQIGQVLLDDRALALRDDEIPPVPPEWRDDVLKRHQPIRSLVSEDFSDLAFLAPLLDGKRLVMLGEHSHGVAEFNWLKVRLVKYLHQKLDFDVVAFESPLVACDTADRLLARVNARTVLEDCLHAVWHTKEVLPLFEYASLMRGSNKKLSISGFDIQDRSIEINNRLQKLLGMIAPPLAVQVSQNEQKVVGALRIGQLPDGKRDRENLITFYESVARTLSSNKRPLEDQYLIPILEIEMAIRAAESRVADLHELSSRSSWTPPSKNFRDKAMADNLEYLLDIAYPGRKIIVWAHNYHINYVQGSEITPAPMGEWLATTRKSETYSVGLYMGRGVAASNDRKHFRLSVSQHDQLLAVMANAGRKMSFVDFSQAASTQGSEWIFQPLVARDWIIDIPLRKPISMFDAVIYVDRVTPPEYLQGRH